MEEWYYEKTSEWTLDYPPFFAAFEWTLSQVARLFDPEMLKVENLGYDSIQAVYFQRLSVIFTELLLVYALHKYIQTSPETTKRSSYAAALSILFSPGLLIIDHIHFQYNGFLYGILLLSLVLARDPKNHPTQLLFSGISFAALLCFKHIYLYLAPAYFVYLLRAYCLGESIVDIKWSNLIKLGGSVLAVFGVAFGPFVYWGQGRQLLARLFPFSRGLCHAYWAPNVWALYSVLDRVLIIVAPKFNLPINATALHSTTRGLVGDTTFAVLPPIHPRTTFLLTLAFQLLSLLPLFTSPSPTNFLSAVTLSAYASFLFGWHVHEKAILLILLPFSLLALKDRRYLTAFRPLAVAGHVSLFPLLFTEQEWAGKVVYTALWLLVFLTTFDRLAPAASGRRAWLLDRFSGAYIALGVVVVGYASGVHGWIWGGRWEFVPMMVVSAYCAVGVLGSWVGFSYLYFVA